MPCQAPSLRRTGTGISPPSQRPPSALSRAVLQTPTKGPLQQWVLPCEDPPYREIGPSPPDLRDRRGRCWAGSERRSVLLDKFRREERRRKFLMGRVTSHGHSLPRARAASPSRAILKLGLDDFPKALLSEQRWGCYPGAQMRQSQGALGSLSLRLSGAGHRGPLHVAWH